MIPSPQLTMVGNKSFLGGRHNVSLLDCGPAIGDEPYDRQTGPQCVSDTDTSDGISNAGTFKSSSCESGKNQNLRICSGGVHWHEHIGQKTYRWHNNNLSFYTTK